MKERDRTILRTIKSKEYEFGTDEKRPMKSLLFYSLLATLIISTDKTIPKAARNKTWAMLSKINNLELLETDCLIFATYREK